jgi:4-hydroxybenzoate polyprenyltransferase
VTGLIRIVHPFPSTLDAAVTAALVLIAGGTPSAALRLGAAMLALQAAIGTANDLVDEPQDRGRKPGKPLPRGLLSRRAAWALFAVTLAVGLALSALSGALVLLVAVVGASIGLVYDGLLKGTVWSWLPFALGVPLLPIYAWLGATGAIPPAFGLLVPAAVAAGAALALANLLADVERDVEAGAQTAATRLGATRAWLVDLALQGLVVAVAAGSLAVVGGRGPGVVAAAAGGLLIAAGVALSRGGAAGRRERAWECQAAGVGLLGAGWVAALVEAGAL